MSVTAEIITIGDELLLGDTIDTNAAWMAKALDNLGISVSRISTISDDEKDIFQALDRAIQTNKLVLITGGLGPTHDDITKFSLSKYFDDELVFNETVENDVKKLLATFGRDISELNKTQAMVPSKCTVIRNPRGTAPGMVFREKNSTVVSMPGVPHEMKSMMETSVIGIISKISSNGIKLHRYIKTFGIAEADLADKLKGAIESMDKELKLAFLPSPGHVKLRFSAKGTDINALEDKLQKEVSKFSDLIGLHAYGFEDDSIASVVGRELKERNQSLAVAESCTGGKLASNITAIPGSSNYFNGSVVAYSNKIKELLLEVDKKDIESKGAVSEEVVSQMAEGVRLKMNADFGLATSGIAGPDGGTKEKPVGTIWIAMSSEEGIKTKKLQLGFDRSLNISYTADYVLNMLRKELTKQVD